MAETAAQTVLDKISKGHLECPICFCRFQDPKMLDCQHSFCLKCLERMVSRRKIKCPICRKETQVPEGGVQRLSSSLLLSSLVDEVNTEEQSLRDASSTRATCESCEDGNEAVSRCLDCKQNICEKCQEEHNRLRDTEDHRIRELDNLRVLPTDLTKTVAPKCRQHSDQNISFHCETCDTLICSMCAATEHTLPDHKYKAISDVMKPFRRRVNDKLQTFEKRQEQLSSNEDAIKQARNRLQKNLAQVRSDIAAKAEAEITKIRNKAKLLTQKVDKIGEERDSEFEKALLYNHEQIERADQMVTAVNDLMRRVDDFELLARKKSVMRSLEFQEEIKYEPAKVDMAFIGVKCQDVVSGWELGKPLLKEEWQLKDEFGKEGTGYGEFQMARGVACFSNGDIVVCDSRLKRVSVFDSSGQYKASIAQGTGGNRLETPFGVAVNCDDLLFVTDKKTVRVFDSELQFLRKFTPWVNDAEKLPGSYLSGIAVDEHSVAVADKFRKVISVHNLDGALIASTSHNMVEHDLAMNNKGRLMFTNYEQKKLLCVDSKDNVHFSVTTYLNGKPAKPTGVLCDDDGSIYVAVHSGELNKNEVQHYNSDGAFISTVAQGLRNPIGMAFTPSGNVVVADRHSVKIFQRM